MDTKTDAKDALRRAAEALGGQSAIATVLGLPDRRHVWPWFNTARAFPTEYCPAIEKATYLIGRPVTCEQLAPTVSWRRVPDPDWPFHPEGKPLVDPAPALSADTTAESNLARAAG